MPSVNWIMDILDLRRYLSSVPRTRPAASPLIADHVTSARYFFFELDRPKGVPLHIVCGGVEHCLPQYDVRRSCFAYYSIEFVLRGRGKVTLRGREFELRPGSAFSYGPRVPHAITTDGHTPLVKYFVDFTGPLSRRFLRSAGLEAGSITASVGNPAPLTDLFNLLILHGHGGTSHHRMLCRSILELIGLHLAMPRQPHVHSTSAFDRGSDTYLKARLYISDNYLRLNSVASIAAKLRIHPAYLCRLFAKYDCCTPYSFLTRLKMQHAAQLLVRSGVMVKQAAEAVGFVDPYHFSRAFKRFHGISPNDFAQSAKQDSSEQ